MSRIKNGKSDLRPVWAALPVYTAALAFAAALVFAAVFPACSREKAEPVRILLTTGGHDFEKEPFFAMFEGLEGVETTAVVLPESASLLKPGLEKDYDALVLYDMAESSSDEERRAFIRLLEQGIGVVSLHHNLGAHRDWPEYARIIGGKYVFSDQTIDGREYPPSTYAHDQDIEVKIRDGGHPVTKGIADFRIHDEAYKGCFISPEVHVLLETDFPGSDGPLAWTLGYGTSRVIYLMLGHDSRAWNHPDFRRFLRNAILWAAKGRVPG